VLNDLPQAWAVPNERRKMPNMETRSSFLEIYSSISRLCQPNQQVVDVHGRQQENGDAAKSFVLRSQVFSLQMKLVRSAANELASPPLCTRHVALVAFLPGCLLYQGGIWRNVSCESAQAEYRIEAGLHVAFLEASKQ
jgi:hypothetical protein